MVVVTTQPSVSHIIDEDHNNIGRPFFRCRYGNAKKQEGKDGIESIHEGFGKKASIKKTIIHKGFGKKSSIKKTILNPK